MSLWKLFLLDYEKRQKKYKRGAKRHANVTQTSKREKQ